MILPLFVVLAAAPTVETLTLRDEARAKNIPVLVRFRANHERSPVVIFSHGGLADERAFPSLSQRLAEAGFVVIHPRHADSRANGRMSMSQMLSRDGRTARVQDVRFMLDQLAQLEERIPALRGKLDREQIGVAGHSFGAFVSQTIGGANMEIDGKTVRLRDPRVKCVVPISAQGVGPSYGFVDSSWNELTIPLMTITGTRDTGADLRGTNADAKTIVAHKASCFERSPAGHKYLVVIEGADHISFGGRQGENAAARITAEMTELFFRAYLKQDDKAKRRLATDPEAGAGYQFRRR